MDQLIKDFHDAGVTKGWLERMAVYILHSPELDELALSWFGQYLDTISSVVQGSRDVWPPVIVAARFLEEKCPTLKRAVHAISR